MRPISPGRKKRSDCGERNANWRGGVTVKDGYEIRNATHKRVHVETVEAVLGKPLPRGAVVHHVNEDRSDNRNNNLVVLQDRAEHNELHRKLRVRRLGGNPWTDKVCMDCIRPKPATSFYSHRAGRCIDCSRADARERQREKRGSSRTGPARVYRIGARDYHRHKFLNADKPMTWVTK